MEQTYVINYDIYSLKNLHNFQLIHQLEVRKYVAVEEERFDRARRLKDAITELLIIGPTLGALEVEKKRLVEKQVRRPML